MRKTLGDNVITSAELPTTETPHQNWGETIQEVIRQEQKKEIADEFYEKGWGYGRIAKILKVGKSTIQDWLKGKRYESVPQKNSDNSLTPTPSENLEAIIAERLAAERAGMEATIAERVRMEADAAERRLAEERTRLDTGTHRQSSRGSKADYFGLDRSGESAMRKFR